MTTPPYTAKTFLDMAFDIVDVASIDFENNIVCYIDRNGQRVCVNSSQTHWIKLGNHGRISTDGQVNKKQ